MARARVGGSSSLISTGDGTPIASPSIPVSNPDDLPADIFTKEVNLKYSNLIHIRISIYHFHTITILFFISSNQYGATFDSTRTSTSNCRQTVSFS